jgi:hypothetical protein
MWNTLPEKQERRWRERNKGSRNETVVDKRRKKED